MRRNNICKFIPESVVEEREIVNFVYEQNLNVIKTLRRITRNRAILVSAGEIIFTINNAEFKCSAGDLLFCFVGDEVVGEPTENASYQYIDFQGERTEGLLRRFLINKTNRHFHGFDGVIPLWKDSLTKASVDNLDLMAESMLLYVFSRLDPNAKERAGVINEVIAYTEHFFTDPDLSLSSVADELNYSSKYLSHLFKKVMGTTYTEYLRVMRIKYATLLLDHGIDSIKNVAVLSGYSDPLYFSTVFKNLIGISPKDYLRSKRYDELDGNEESEESDGEE